MTPAPRALILRAPGTNCDEETAEAWQRAGAATETCHVHRVLESPQALEAFQIITIPGGFSYGDDLGAGRILATRLATLAEELARFRDRGGLILGICNGFQVLVRAGLLPGDGQPRATLTRNDSGQFEARWVTLLGTPGRCAFIDSDVPMRMPVAHGEGKFLTTRPEEFEQLAAGGHVVVRYLDETGQPTASYPANPNGSPHAVAGICDRTGRVFGLMPHPERHIDRLQDPLRTRQRDSIKGPGDGLRIFQQAVRSLG